MNHAIIQIGGNHFLCPSVAVGAKIVELLGKCAEVDHDYVQDASGHHRYVYTPMDKMETLGAQVELKVVSAEQIQKRAAKVPKSRRLGFTETLEPTA